MAWERHTARRRGQAVAVGVVRAHCPPAGWKSFQFEYLPDTVLKRWSTRITLDGTGAFEYRGDTKGRLSAILNPFSQLFTTEYDRDGKPTVE